MVGLHESHHASGEWFESNKYPLTVITPTIT